MDTSKNTDINISKYKGFESIYDKMDEMRWKTKNEGYKYEDTLFFPRHPNQNCINHDFQQCYTMVFHISFLKDHEFHDYNLHILLKDHDLQNHLILLQTYMTLFIIELPTTIMVSLFLHQN